MKNWNELKFDAKPVLAKIEKLKQQGVVILPERGIFNALTLTPHDQVKAVIIGQDPYHTSKHPFTSPANGLAFSVNKGIQKPPSLVNIFTELKSDLGYDEPEHGDLTSWAKEGVLLLNTCLTVSAGKPGSHKNIGWAPLIEEIIENLPQRVWILWGSHARNFKDIIPDPIGIIESPHPSPFSAHTGFFGSSPFSKCNNFLINKGKAPINWEI